MNIWEAFEIGIASKDENSILHIKEINDTSPIVRLLPYYTRYCIAAFLIISFLIGSFYKFSLYKYILVSSKMNNGSYFKMTPINVMIFSSAIIHHTTHFYIGVYLAISIGTDVSFEELFGMQFCNATLFIGIELL